MSAGVLAKAALAALSVPPTALPDVNVFLYAPGGIALVAYLYLSMRRVYPDRPLVGAARCAVTAVLIAGSLFLTFLGAALYTTLMLG